MGKATRSLSGASQKKYIRDLLRATEGLTAGPAEELAQTIEREVAQIRVRLPIPERGARGHQHAAKATKAAASPAQPQDGPPAGALASPAGHAAGAFDPFAFSVVVVVTKEGRAGLMQRLEQISAIEDLRALAKAQHVALPEEAASLDEIRSAIADGALQRIANRRAAAS